MLARRGFLASCGAAVAGLATKAFGGTVEPADDPMAEGALYEKYEGCFCRRFSLFVDQEELERRRGEAVLTVMPCPCGGHMPIGRFMLWSKSEQSCPYCDRHYELDCTCVLGDHVNEIVHAVAIHVRELCIYCREVEPEALASCACQAPFLVMDANDPRAFFCPCGDIIPTRRTGITYQGVCKRSCSSCGRRYNIREDSFPCDSARNPLTVATVQETCESCDPFWKEPPKLGTNAESTRRNQLQRQFTTFPMRLEDFS